MVEITIPFIPFLFAIFAFMILTYILIDEDDRMFSFILSTIFSIFCFLATYGFLSFIGI